MSWSEYVWKHVCGYTLSIWKKTPMRCPRCGERNPMFVPVLKNDPADQYERC